MLTSAFRNLINLKTVEILEPAYDGPRSFGYRLGMERGRNGDVTYSSRLFFEILTALSHAGARPENLDMKTKYWGVFEMALDLPPNLEPSARPVLANLQRLHLTLDGTARDISWSHTEYTLPFKFTTSTTPISDMPAKFLSYTSNLSWLCLDFVEHHPLQIDEMMQRLAFALSERPSSLTYPVSLSGLRRLDMVRAKVSASVMMQLVTKLSPTLRSLSFTRCTLAYQPLPDADAYSVWSEFLIWLSHNSRLDDIRLCNLRGMPDTAFSVPSSTLWDYVGWSRTNPILDEPERAYSGPAMVEYLQQMAQAIMSGRP
jgi:hypothetical protein